MATPEDGMELSLCAGTDLVNGQIVFSHDSKYFMCCAGWRVKVYSVASGQCAQLLEGHTDIVTGLTINPANKLQLFSCGLDGNIKQWVYLEGVLLRTFSFYMPLHALISVDSNAASATVIAQRPQATNCSVLRLALKRSRRSSTSTPEGSSEDQVKVKSDILLSVCLPQHNTVSHGCDGQYMAAVHGHEMSVYSFSKKSHRKLTTESSNPFTCVACHPIEVCLATGHKNGNITFWWNMFSKDKMVVSSVHWHSLPVHCLAFSPEGSSLLSGGEECVLVRWQMNSEHKDFLPRLGSPLHSLAPSPDGNMVITAHSDNVLQLINSSFVVLNAVRGLARAHQGAWGRERCVGGGSRGVGLVVDPRSGALVTNGRPGHLQFYNMTTDTQLFNLDIVGENYVSPDSTDSPHTVTEVEQAAFDPSGDWLATYQRWDDGVTSPEFCLKFWRYSTKKQNYQLTTTVESPHYKAVQCLRFKPSVDQQPPMPTMVSTGHDGCFKLWTLTTTSNNQRGGQWGCEAVGHYGGRGVGEARFSADGTTLAVVFDNVLTLWDPDTNSMMDRVVMDTSIRCVEFVRGKQGGQYLAVSTCDHLTVLDLSSLSVHMQLSLPGALLATDGDLICAVTSQQTLYMFRPTDAQPVYQKKNATQNPVIGLVFLPQHHTDGQADKQTDGQTEAEPWQSRHSLYIMDSMYRLYTPSSVSKKSLPPSSQVELKRVLPQTPFQALLSAQQQEKMQQDGMKNIPSLSLQPFKHLDVMNEGFSTEVSVSKRLHSLLDTLMLPNPRMARPMEVEECKGEEDEQEEEEAVAMET